MERSNLTIVDFVFFFLFFFFFFFRGGMRIRNVYDSINNTWKYFWIVKLVIYIRFILEINWQILSLDRG